MSRTQKFSQKPKSIAVLRALQLGDLLCSVPAFRALRAGCPDAHISLIGLPWAKDFTHRFRDYIDEFIEFPGFPGLPERAVDVARIPTFLQEIQNRQFDLAIQMHGSGSFVNSLTVLLGAKQSAGFYLDGDYCPDPSLFLPYDPHATEIHQQLRLMEFLGFPAQDDQLEYPLFPRDEAESSTLQSLYKLAPGKYFCLHAGGRMPSRRWPTERFAKVADTLSSWGLRAVLTGTLEESQTTRAVANAMKGPVVDLTGQTTLGALGALVRDAGMVISNDTSISHIAAAFKTPSVVIACGSDVGRWAPLDKSRHKVVFHDIDCRPCSHAECPVPGHPCAREVQPAAVIAEAAQALRSQRSLVANVEKPDLVGVSLIH